MRERQPMAPRSTRRTPAQANQALAVYLEDEQEARRAASWVLTLLAQEEALPLEQRRPEMTWPPPAEPSAAMEIWPGAWRKGLQGAALEIKVDLENMDRGDRCCDSPTQAETYRKDTLRDLAHDVAAGVKAVAFRRAVRTYGHWPALSTPEFEDIELGEFDILARKLIEWINEQRLKDPVIDVKA
jgi:hypothetical protein